MKKFVILFVLLGLLFTSCNNNTPKSPYKNGDYVYFTMPGIKNVDTLFGQIDMGILNEPIPYNDTTFYYRIKFKLNDSIYDAKWIYNTSIIRKK